jgi:hypothetical protein
MFELFVFITGGGGGGVVLALLVLTVLFEFTTAVLPFPLSPPQPNVNTTSSVNRTTDSSFLIIFSFHTTASLCGKV